MHFMFLLQDGRLAGDSEGGNHTTLMGWNSEDGDPHQIQQSLCEQNKALRICFQPISKKDDGTRGDFWSVYVEIDNVSPNEAQWTTLSALYRLKGWRHTIVVWDVYASGRKREWIHGEGSLTDLRRLVCPLPPKTQTKKVRRSKALLRTPEVTPVMPQPAKAVELRVHELEAL